jgi:serine-type D-Ala-D-Ala carboxypeptidase/endopeptidase (penicillin-binding protein 4)
MRLLGMVFSLLCGLGAAQGQSSLPPAVEDALQRAKLPRDALSVVVWPVAAPGTPRLQHQADVPRNPASLMKLVTTSAALDMLGPAFTWRTPVYLEGQLRGDVWHGQVYLQGSGDPKLGVEQLWLLLRRLQGLGIRQIQGDIVLDRSLFALPPHDPASFDGEPLRPYNAAPDALLLNYKSLMFHFVPDPAHKVARVHWEPPLAGVQLQASVPLMGGDCADYRASLKPEFGNPLSIRFMGGFPASCSDKLWPVAYADPDQFASRAVLGMWQQLGGQLSGSVRDGSVPTSLKPVFFAESATLGEVVRDINKFSNNVMADQLFLTLAAHKRGTATPLAAKEVMEVWWRERIGGEPPLIDKGSGLSREMRISAHTLARLLQWTWLQSFHAGVDGLTAAHRRGRHPQAQQKQRQCPPENRQFARQHGHCGLCGRTKRPAFCAGGHAEPPEREPRQAGDGRLDRLGGWALTLHFKAAARCNLSRTPSQASPSGGVSTQISCTPLASMARSCANNSWAHCAASEGIFTHQTPAGTSNTERVHNATCTATRGKRDSISSADSNRSRARGA